MSKEANHGTRAVRAGGQESSSISEAASIHQHWEPASRTAVGAFMMTLGSSIVNISLPRLRAPLASRSVAPLSG